MADVSTDENILVKWNDNFNRCLNLCWLLIKTISIIKTV